MVEMSTGELLDWHRSRHIVLDGRLVRDAACHACRFGRIHSDEWSWLTCAVDEMAEARSCAKPRRAMAWLDMCRYLFHRAVASPVGDLVHEWQWQCQMAIYRMMLGVGHRAGMIGRVGQSCPRMGKLGLWLHGSTGTGTGASAGGDGGGGEMCVGTERRVAKEGERPCIDADGSDL